MYRTLQCSELRLHIKRVSYFQFVVCLQIDPICWRYDKLEIVLNAPSASLRFALCNIS